MEFGEFIIILYIFVLAVFLGFEIITKVPPTLHTPLMSGSNAISGITMLGAMLVVGSSKTLGSASYILGMLALVLATINVFGGYFVTHRMLKMFKQKKPRTRRRDSADAENKNVE